MGPRPRTPRTAPSAYAAAHRLAEAVAIAAFAVMGLQAFLRVAGSVDSPERLGLAAACALLGWLATDLVSGLGHWIFDTWGGVDTPFVGPWFVRPFREHHSDPQAITRHDFVETNGSTCLAALALLGAAAALPDTAAWTHHLLVFTALCVPLSNQCHKWAHEEAARVPPWVSALQRLRIVLHPEHHRRHHRRPHDSCYCTASGWLNGPIDAIGAFRALERLAAILLRIAPRRGGE